MRTILIFLIFFTILSCTRKNSETKNISVEEEEDTLRVFTTSDIQKIITVLKEKDLTTDTTGIIETRFYFFQPRFSGLFEFYRINYSDSTLCLKEFTLVDPSGAGEDSIYSTKTIKLTSQNLKNINKLLNKSMFWSLKNIIESDLYFDADTYIYESVRVENKRKSNSKRQHHWVYSYAPINRDFINFGQYLKFLAGQKNTYNDKD